MPTREMSIVVGHISGIPPENDITKAKTLFAHKILHMWYKNPSKTNWTKQQIEDEHTKVVKAMVDFGMNHNMVSAIDKTLPQYLQDKSGKK